MPNNIDTRAIDAAKLIDVLSSIDGHLETIAQVMEGLVFEPLDLALNGEKTDAPGFPHYDALKARGITYLADIPASASGLRKLGFEGADIADILHARSKVLAAQRQESL